MILSRLLSILMVLGLSPAAVAAVDLSKIAHKIVKEPAYRSKPKYCLLVLGPEAKTRVWAVLDKSGPGATDYDVLYFDRNADGDLLAP